MYPLHSLLLLHGTSNPGTLGWSCVYFYLESKTVHVHCYKPCQTAEKLPLLLWIPYSPHLLSSGWCSWNCREGGNRKCVLVMIQASLKYSFALFFSLFFLLLKSLPFLPALQLLQPLFNSCICVETGRSWENNIRKKPAKMCKQR